MGRSTPQKGIILVQTLRNTYVCFYPFFHHLHCFMIVAIFWRPKWDLPYYIALLRYLLGGFVMTILFDAYIKAAFVTMIITVKIYKSGIS